MGLFELLHGARNRASTLDERTRSRLIEAWGLDEGDLAERAPEETAGGTPLDYDRTQWVRKLRHLLDELPDSEPRWEVLVREGRAKRFDETWMRGLMLDEFAMMVRRAVADRVFTERERKNLDQARSLIGLNEAEASAIYASVVREAESFFGEHVEGT
ncbi:hypothetical protein [Tautonia plasticadhaerens]|uniref:Uncharacterized protein n=1 Tax=Tautonia plasticadhaerens TaxID=2527974 RepID=A0A518HAW2_9BACT|nr:hypothetical protein [Tautonia plasticadhaerens]QDV37979.1 hypothetical protein ElP_59260 [Tautonia plasticadhaerens]